MSQDKRPGSSFMDEAPVENSADREPQTDEEHYLFKRHGTLDLNPMPRGDPADPLNWPAWKAR